MLHIICCASLVSHSLRVMLCCCQCIDLGAWPESEGEDGSEGPERTGSSSNLKRSANAEEKKLKVRGLSRALFQSVKPGQCDGREVWP